MTTTPEHDARIANMTFASVYPHYVTKIEKKGRTREELHQVIEWLTGFDEIKLQELIDQKVTFETFFGAAHLNPHAHLITGVICGYRIEDIETPLTRQTRYLDKLVEELARGRKMEKNIERTLISGIYLNSKNLSFFSVLLNRNLYKRETSVFPLCFGVHLNVNFNLPPVSTVNSSCSYKNISE